MSPAPTMEQAHCNTQGWRTKTSRPCNCTMAHMHHAEHHADIRDNLPRNCRVRNAKPNCDGSKGLAGGPSGLQHVQPYGAHTRRDNQDACICVRETACPECLLCCSSGRSATGAAVQCANASHFSRLKALKQSLEGSQTVPNEHTLKQAIPTQAVTNNNTANKLPRKHSCPRLHSVTRRKQP